jgi:hypothetical protein
MNDRYPNVAGAYNPELLPSRANDEDDYYGQNDETGEVIPGDPEPMDEHEFRSRVFNAIQDTATYIDSYIAPGREAAMSYYLGEKFGNEEDGRSQVVMTEVRDTVLAMIPSLLRIFTAGEKVVEFIPKGPEDVAVAEQMTDLIDHIFMKQNPGFRILHDAIKDALIVRDGILTWYHSDDEKVEEHEYSGLSPDEAQYILSDPEIELMSMTETQGASLSEGPSVFPMQENVAPPEISLRIRRVTRTPKYVVECIPPEQFLIDNEATCIDDALIVGRRKLATVSELVSMGYPREIIEENSGTGGFEMNLEALTRNPADQSFFGIGDGIDESTNKVYYVEAYVRIDRDGDGIAELHRVCCIGNGSTILNDEVVQDIPFAILCPDPTPHTVFGKGIADQTMDLQAIKSQIVRNTLDSLAQSIHPRTAVVEGQVNMDDVLNNETGAIIRMRTAGAVQPFSTPFVGQPALGVLAYLDEVKTQRTGISRASQGLDAEALQSTTRSAVQAQLSSSQDRIELIARLFADSIKRCFQGLLRLVVQHQDKPMILRLRNKFVPIDPRGWDSEMDMQINIALGRGSDEQRMAFLQQIAQKQEQIIQTYGPFNPMVDLQQYRQTMAQIIQLSGFADPSQFVKEITPESVNAFMQQQQQNKKPDMAEMLAKVEAEKTRADIVIAAAKQELETRKAQSDADFERDKLAADVELRSAEIQAKYGAQVDMAWIKGEMDKQRTEIQEMFAIQSQREQQMMQPPPPQEMAPPMDPGMMDPGMMDPGMMDPGMMDPGMMQPELPMEGLPQQGLPFPPEEGQF